jgi:hypothetical protein
VSAAFNHPPSDPLAAAAYSPTGRPLTNYEQAALTQQAHQIAGVSQTPLLDVLNQLTSSPPTPQKKGY